MINTKFSSTLRNKNHYPSRKAEDIKQILHRIKRHENKLVECFRLDYGTVNFECEFSRKYFLKQINKFNDFGETGLSKQEKIYYQPKQNFTL